MFRKIIVAAALTTALVAPAFAATSYYVEQSASTHKCSVTTHKPDGKSFTMIGKDTFKTKTAADSAMKTATACKA